MGSVKTIIKDKPVFFVTELVTDNAESTRITNETIDALCAKYQNAHKIDRHALASQDTSAYLADNCHPRNSWAISQHASLVREALVAAA